MRLLAKAIDPQDHVAAGLEALDGISDELTESFAPLRILIERPGGIEKMQVGAPRQGSRICPRREEVAVAQDVLPIGKHEVEEQDRGVRMRRAA